VTTPAADIRPMRSLGLLSVAHAINHAQAVLLPLIFIKIIDEFTVGVDDIAFLVAFGAFAAGAVQLSYAYLTRVVSRRRLLGFGGILFGGGFAAHNGGQIFNWTIECTLMLGRPAGENSGLMQFTFLVDGKVIAVSWLFI
jgi:hypothetical protein